MDLPQNTLASSAIFLTILRRFFKYSIGEQLPQWCWDEDPLTTKLVIELSQNYKLEEVQKRPAIYIQRGTFTTRRLVFGDMAKPEHQTRTKEPTNYDKVDLYSKEVQGTISINAYALEGGEAEAIANLIFECFVTQEQLLEREFKYKWLGDVSIGPIGVLEEDRTIYNVQITISPVIYDFVWSNKVQGPLLKRLGMQSQDIDQIIKTAVYNEFFPSK